MVKPPRFSDRDDAAPAEGAEGPPTRDARPALDTHFLLLEVGKLGHATERLIRDIEKIDSKLERIIGDINDLKHGVAFAKGAVWVIGILVVLVGVGIGWFINGKLAISLHPGS